MANLSGNFQQQIEQWANQMDERINQVVRKIVLDIYTRIAQRTAVKTGRAITNWMVAKGTPITTATLDADPTGMQAMQAAMSVFATYDYKVDTAIFITNSVPYIMRLEHGSSKQHPEGMVRVTVAEFQNIIQAQII